MKFTLLLSAFTFLVFTSLFSQSIQFEKLPHAPSGLPAHSEVIGDTLGNWYAYVPIEAFDSSIFFYRSNDAGANWEQMDAAYNPMLVSPDGILYKVLQLKLYKSLDRGDSWELASNEEYFEPVVTANGTLLQTSYGGIRRSTNQGASSIDIIVNYGNATQSLYSPYVARDGSIYAFGGNTNMPSDTVHLFRSTDDGISWQFINSFNLAVNAVTSLYSASSGRIFRSANSGGSSLFYSDDLGATWEAATIGSTSLNSLVELASGELWACTNDGCFRSVDNGANWQPITTIGINPYIITISKLWQLPNNHILGASGNLLHQAADDSFEHWDLISEGFEKPVITSIEIVDDLDIWVCTTGGLFRTNDGGQTWAHVFKYPLSYFSGAHGVSRTFCLNNMTQPIVVDRKHVWRINANTGIFIDATPPGFNMNADVITSINSLVNGDIILGTNHKTFISKDAANTWFQLPNPGLLSTVMEAYFLTDSTYLLKTNVDEVYAYNPFTAVVNPYPIASISSGLISDLTVVQSGIIYVAGVDPNYCVSADYGENWSCKDFLPGNEYIRHLVANERGEVFADTYFGHGLNYSTDQGVTWVNLNDSSTIIPNPARITAMKISPSQRLYIGGYGENHLVRSVLETSASHETAQLLSLSIYPNPSSGLLQLDIPNNGFANGRITLSVTDLYGKMRHSEVLEYAPTFQRNMKDLPSGIYFVSLKDAQGQVIGIGKWIKGN